MPSLDDTLPTASPPDGYTDGWYLEITTDGTVAGQVVEDPNTLLAEAVPAGQWLELVVESDTQGVEVPVQEYLELPVLGEPGPKGADGIDGVDGASWLLSDGIPANTVGANGDFAIDTSQTDAPFYHREQGVWLLQGHLQGPQGPQGDAGQDADPWLVGDGDPAATVGDPNQVYLDQQSGYVWQKQTSGWVRVANIKGPKGDSWATPTQASFRGEWDQNGTLVFAEQFIDGTIPAWLSATSTNSTGGVTALSPTVVAMSTAVGSGKPNYERALQVTGQGSANLGEHTDVLINLSGIPELAGLNLTKAVLYASISVNNDYGTYHADMMVDGIATGLYDITHYSVGNEMGQGAWVQVVGQGAVPHTTFGVRATHTWQSGETLPVTIAITGIEFYATALDPYLLGDTVTYDNQLWISVIDDNHDQPGAGSTWQQIPFDFGPGGSYQAYLDEQIADLRTDLDLPQTTTDVTLTWTGDQIASFTERGIVYTFTYEDDGNGNQRIATDTNSLTGITRQFTYDTDGHLTGMIEIGG